MKLKRVKLFVGLIASGWSLFLTFKILEYIEATELMWFLFWGIVPLSVTLGILHALVEN